MKRMAGLLAIVAASLLMGACAVNRATATVDPTARLEEMHVLQVKRLDGEDGTIHTLIADRLRTRGYTLASTEEAPGKVDAVVTYVDKWMWDLSMYLLELTITFRDPATDFPLASGNSYHTSLTRKSPPEMVDEVLENIFNESGKSK